MSSSYQNLELKRRKIKQNVTNFKFGIDEKNKKRSIKKKGRKGKKSRKSRQQQMDFIDRELGMTNSSSNTGSQYPGSKNGRSNYLISEKDSMPPFSPMKLKVDYQKQARMADIGNRSLGATEDASKDQDQFVEMNSVFRRAGAGRVSPKRNMEPVAVK